MIFFIFIQILKETPVSKQWKPDQTLHVAASDLILHCLLMSLKKDARFIWVKGLTVQLVSGGHYSI